MPTAITLASPAAFTNPLFKPLPVVSGAMFWSYIGASLAASQNVIAGGKQYANLGVGPTYQSNYMRTTGALGCLLAGGAGDAEPPAGTVMTVVRTPGGGTSGAGAGIFSAAGVNSIQFSFTGSTSLAMFVGGVGGTTLNLTIPSATTAFKFLASSWGGNTPVSIYDETDNLSVLTGPSAAGAQGALLQGLGGAGTGGTNDRPCDMAFFAMYNSVLSKAQIDQFYAHVKDVLAGRGIAC